MKKLLLGLLAATTLMGTVASATNFTVKNHTQAVVEVNQTDNSGANQIFLVNSGDSVDVPAVSLGVKVLYAGYGYNWYSEEDGVRNHTIHVWQQQPGYFAITEDKVTQ